MTRTYNSLFLFYLLCKNTLLIFHSLKYNFPSLSTIFTTMSFYWLLRFQTTYIPLLPLHYRRKISLILNIQPYFLYWKLKFDQSYYIESKIWHSTVLHQCEFITTVRWDAGIGLISCWRAAELTIRRDLSMIHTLKSHSKPSQLDIISSWSNHVTLLPTNNGIHWNCSSSSASLTILRLRVIIELSSSVSLGLS